MRNTIRIESLTEIKILIFKHDGESDRASAQII